MGTDGLQPPFPQFHLLHRAGAMVQKCWVNGRREWEGKEVEVGMALHTWRSARQERAFMEENEDTFEEWETGLRECGAMWMMDESVDFHTVPKAWPWTT